MTSFFLKSMIYSLYTQSLSLCAAERVQYDLLLCSYSECVWWEITMRSHIIINYTLLYDGASVSCWGCATQEIARAHSQQQSTTYHYRLPKFKYFNNDISDSCNTLAKYKGTYMIYKLWRFYFLNRYFGWPPHYPESTFFSVCEFFRETEWEGP